MSNDTTNSGVAVSARRLRVAVFAAMALMILLYVAARVGAQIGPAHVIYEERVPNPAAAAIIGDVAMALVLVALYRLTQMLRLIAGGEMFSAAVIRRFRSFAFWLLLMALFGLLAPIAAELMDPAGAARLQVKIDFREVLTVGITLVLFLLARLLERARRLDEEMREFV